MSQHVSLHRTDAIENVSAVYSSEVFAGHVAGSASSAAVVVPLVFITHAGKKRR